MLKEVAINVCDEDRVLAIANALNAKRRLKMLAMLSFRSYNISEISHELDLPISTTRLDLNLLKTAGLVEMQKVYTQTGQNVVVFRTTDTINIGLIERRAPTEEKTFEFTIPIGSFASSEDITAPCGMAGISNTLGIDNDESLFYSAERHRAELLWFTSGFLEYRVKLPPATKNFRELEISFEACSEAPLYNNNYRSDISLILNDKLVAIWNSPGDFGGIRGQLNPHWWPDDLTQFGMLTHWTIDEMGTKINNEFASYTRISEIDFSKHSFLSIKIGVDKNAKHCGGMNLFGKSFGNHPTELHVKFKV